MTRTIRRGLMAGAAWTAAPSYVHVSQPPRRPRPRGLLLRSVGVGTAAGFRSSFGIATIALANPGAGPARGAVAALAVATELSLDKLPAAPSRLQPPSLAARGLAGAGAAAALARRESAALVLPSLVGGAAALAGSYAGLRWRESASARRSPVRAALAEDAAGVVLAALAVRTSR